MKTVSKTATAQEILTKAAQDPTPVHKTVERFASLSDDELWMLVSAKLDRQQEAVDLLRESADIQSWDVWQEACDEYEDARDDAAALLHLLGIRAGAPGVPA